MKATEETATREGVGSIELLEPKPRRRKTSSLLVVALAAAMIPPGYLGVRGGRRYDVEPPEKSPEDLARIAAASEKRARKKAARERQRQLSKGSNRRHQPAAPDQRQP